MRQDERHDSVSFTPARAIAQLANPVVQSVTRNCGNARSLAGIVGRIASGAEEIAGAACQVSPITDAVCMQFATRFSLFSERKIRPANDLAFTQQVFSNGTLPRIDRMFLHGRNRSCRKEPFHLLSITHASGLAFPNERVESALIVVSPLTAFT